MRQATLTKLQSQLLEKLGAVHFATQAQLCAWTGQARSNVSVALTALFNLEFISGELLASPRIFYIARGGCDFLGIPPPSGRRLPSWSVMAHACHRNAVAFAMAESDPGFTFLSRLALLKQGFNPGHGEHCAVGSDGTTWFVLLDDFLMGSDRIARAWTRRHSPNPKYWRDPTGRVWRDVAHKYLVVTTDEKQAERHRARIERDRTPAEVMTIKPLWKTT